jgi:hypothetical protein
MILFFPNAEGVLVGISTDHVIKIDQWNDGKCLVHLAGTKDVVTLGALAEYVADQINRAGA